MIHVSDYRKTTSVDILFYVEDPGAANYVAHLPSILKERGRDVYFYADEPAHSYLLQSGTRRDLLHRSTTSKQLLSIIKPKVVIIGTSENPETYGFDLIITSRDLKITTIGVIDAYGNADYRFRGTTEDPLRYAPDWLVVSDEWTKRAYVALGYPVGKIVVCGHPYYDYVRNIGKGLAKEDKKILRKRVLPGVSEDQKVVIFVAEVSDGLNPAQYQRSPEYTLRGRGNSTGRTEIVLEEFIDAMKTLKQKPYLVLRLHPKNRTDDLKEYFDDFDFISKNEPPTELVYVADLVVGMTSMLLLEAAILDAPTLSIIPREKEKKSLPTIMNGITPCVTTRSNLSSMLSKLLVEKQDPLSKLNEQVFYFGASERIVEFIETFLADKADIIR